MMDEMLTAAEVAKPAKLSEAFVYKAAREGLIPHIRIGRCLRFPRQGVLDWIESQTFRPKTDPAA